MHKRISRPKTFKLHWGSGVIEEEIQVVSRHHRPTVQLLKFTTGDATGTYEIRFCYYDHNGRFQRWPLIISENDLFVLRNALGKAPQLKRMLAILMNEAL